MTKAEYDQYQTDLKPFIGGTDLVAHAYPDVLLTFLAIEPYEEGVDEWPKAVFRGSNGRPAYLALSVALDLLRKHRRK